MEKKLHKWLCRIQDVLFVGLVVVLVWLFLQVSTYATFRIPSDSMEPAILAGDHIVVNKWIMGGRVFNLFDDMDQRPVIHRLPGQGEVERNDVLVFNFPYSGPWDSISMDWRKFYLKRCVALPGDTFEIKDAHYRVRGVDQALGNAEAQDILARLIHEGVEKERGVVMKGFPYGGDVDWDMKDFGPLYIPKAGERISMNRLNQVLYKNVIEWEQDKKLEAKGDSILLGDILITEYCFKENYYFVAGDKVFNSQDSRYWGLLPEPYIVGVATWIWKSVDPVTNKVRWDRVLKRIE